MGLQCIKFGCCIMKISWISQLLILSVCKMGPRLSCSKNVHSTQNYVGVGFGQRVTIRCTYQTCLCVDLSFVLYLILFMLVLGRNIIMSLIGNDTKLWPILDKHRHHVCLVSQSNRRHMSCWKIMSGLIYLTMSTTLILITWYLCQNHMVGERSSIFV